MISNHELTRMNAHILIHRFHRFSQIENLRILKCLVLIWCSLVVSASADKSAETPLTYFNQGNEYYKAGKFAQAIAQWQKIIGEGIKNHNVYFNLGNAYYKQDKKGLAIACYLKARLLDPTDKDSAANLRFVSQQTVDKITLPEKGPLRKFMIAIFDWLSPNLLTVLFTVFYLGIFSWLSICVVKKKTTISSTILWILVGGVILAGGLLGEKLHQLNISRGVVGEPKLDILSGPGEDYTLISTIHEGTTFTILEEGKGWLEIVLLNGVKGWVKEGGVIKLKIKS